MKKQGKLIEHMYKRASLSKGEDPTKPKKAAKNQGYVNIKNKQIEENPRAIGGLTVPEIQDYQKNVLGPKQQQWNKMLNRGELTKSQVSDSAEYYKPDKADLKQLPKPTKSKSKSKWKISGGDSPFY